MKKDLPIYDIKLSDDTQGVGFISLVDEPAIGVDWIKLAKQEVQEPVELFMSLTDNGLCFGCPPNGDGTRVNGEPDARCKGDSAGGGSKGGSKSGSKGGSKVSSSGMDPMAIDKFGGPMDRKMEYEDTYLDNKQKMVGALPRKEREQYSNRTREIISKYGATGTVAGPKVWDQMTRDEKIEYNKIATIMNDTVTRENALSGIEGARRKEAVEKEKKASEKRINNNPLGKGLKGNDEYKKWSEKNGLVARDDTGQGKGWISNDDTWDYKTGQEKGRPSAGSRRVARHERRSSDDIREGYPSHKTWITWE